MPKPLKFGEVTWVPWRELVDKCACPQDTDPIHDCPDCECEPECDAIIECPDESCDCSWPAGDEFCGLSQSGEALTLVGCLAVAERSEFAVSKIDGSVVMSREFPRKDAR